MREMHYPDSAAFYSRWWPDCIASIQSFVRHTMEDIEDGGGGGAPTMEKIHGRLQTIDIRLSKLIDFIFKNLEILKRESPDSAQGVIRDMWLYFEPLETREERGEAFWPWKGIRHVFDDED